MKRKRIFVWLLLLVILVGAMLALWRQRGVTVTPTLFTDLPAAEAPSSFPGQATAKRYRWVRFDQLGLPQLSLKPGEEKRVVLNLFPDLEVEATIMANKTHWNEDQSVFGLVEDDPNSLLVISRHKDVMMGMVALPDGRQVLVSHVSEGRYVVVEVDVNKVGGCGNCAAMARENPARPAGQGKAAPANDGVKTGAVPKSAWSRKLAMANIGAVKEAKETQAQCDKCHPGDSSIRVQPLLAALGAPSMLLAASSQYPVHGRGGLSGNVGQSSRNSIKFQRPGNVDYIDVLFVYSAALLAQEGNLTQIQTKATLALDIQNAIFTVCGIPLEVRQAGDLTAARSRVYDNSNVPPGYAGGGAKPAWEPVPGSLGPVQQDRTATTGTPKVADPKQYTVWNPAVGIGQKQAYVGRYQPKYADINTTAPSDDILGCLLWIIDRRNSLLYGDQHWGSADSEDGTPQPFINLPEGFEWRLTPPEQIVPAPGIPTPLIFDITANNSLNTGPVDYTQSSHTFGGLVENTAPDLTHSPVERYDFDGNSTTYGVGYDPNYSGVLGIRMDLNSTDYANAPFTGDIYASNAGARYPVLHGQEGNFTDGAINQAGWPNKVDVRADIVCVLVDDNLPDWRASTGTANNWGGIGDKYNNLVPVGPANLSHGLGRGLLPEHNDLQQSPFSMHAGQLIAGATVPHYEGIFTTADLTSAGAVNDDNSSGLVALYSFNGDLDDGSTNSNIGTPATIVAPGWSYGADRNNTPSQAGNATDGYVLVPNHPSIDLPNGFSFGAWVYMDSVAGTQTILSKTGEFKLEIRAGGTQLRVELDDSTAPTFIGNSAVTFTALTWYHVYVTYDDVLGAVKLYVNGFEVVITPSGGGTFVGPLANSPNDLLIGTSSVAGATRVQGLVDEVRIYNVAFTADEVLNLYIAEKPASTFGATQGLVLHYTFDDNTTSLTSFTDFSTQGNNAASVGTPGPAQAADRYGVPGRAYLLNPLGSGTGTINTQTSNGFPAGYEDFTLSLWLNNSTAGGFGSGRRAIVATQFSLLELQIDSNTGRLEFYSGPGFVPGVPDHQTPPLPWVGNTWYHVVLKCENNATTIYRDGVAQGTPTATSLGDITPAQSLIFGDGQPGLGVTTDDLNGSIDEVRLYTRSLGDTEVKELYMLEKPVVPTFFFDSAVGLGGHYPVQGPPDTNNAVFDQSIGANHGNALFTVLVDGRGGALDVNGSYDLPGPGSNGFLNLTNGHSALGNGSFTVSFWTNPDLMPAGGNTMHFLGNRIINETAAGSGVAGPPDNTDSWWVDMNRTGHVSFHAANNGAAVTAQSVGNLTIGAWSQVIITRDATVAMGGTGTVNIYIDGVPQGSGVVDIDVNGTGRELWAGGAPFNSGTQSFNLYDGKLDEIRIYQGRRFAAWQAAELYNEENPNPILAGTASIRFNFGTDLNDPGDALRLELFNNALTDPTFYDGHHNGTGLFLNHSFSGNEWQNLRGAFRLGATTGSALIDSIVITINSGPLRFTGTIVPPNTSSAIDFFKNVELNRDRTFGMVVRLNQAQQNWTFAHELGHILGCHHGLGDNGLGDDSPEITFNPYGREENTTMSGVVYTRGVGNSMRDSFLAMGNHFTAFAATSFGANSPASWGRYCTIMAYDRPSSSANAIYQRVPRYSSPGLLWNGTLTGENAGRMLPPPFGFYNRPMYFDHVKAISTIGPVSSFFRDESGSGRTTVNWSGSFSTPVGVPDPATQSGNTNKKLAKLNNPSGRGKGDGPSRTMGRGLMPPSQGSSTPGSTPPTPIAVSGGGKAQSGRGLGASTSSPPTTTPQSTPSPQSTQPDPTKPDPTKPNPTKPNPTKPNPTKPSTTTPPPPVKTGGGKPGGSLPNDSRENSLPMVLRKLADNSFLATANGHNRGATGGENASLSTDDGRQTFHGRSVWWHVIAPVSGIFDLQVDTRGSAIDTTLGVWLDNGLKPLAANDNDPRRPGPASAVRRSLTLRRGQRIVLAVDGVNGAQGQVRLNVRLKPLGRRR